MGLGYDDMVRYAEASLAAHERRVTELAAQSTDGSWGDTAMRHRQSLESWRSAQHRGVCRRSINVHPTVTMTLRLHTPATRTTDVEADPCSLATRGSRRQEATSRSGPELDLLSLWFSSSQPSGCHPRGTR